MTQKQKPANNQARPLKALLQDVASEAGIDTRSPVDLFLSLRELSQPLNQGPAQSKPATSAKDETREDFWRPASSPKSVGHPASDELIQRINDVVSGPASRLRSLKQSAVNALLDALRNGK